MKNVLTKEDYFFSDILIFYIYVLFTFVARQNEKLIKQEFYGRGKVLITGEYGVLDGALAFAIPTKFGQGLTVKSHRSSDINWISYNADGEKWFQSKISLYDFKPIETTNEEVSEFLYKLLKSAVRLNSEFLSKWNGFKVETKLEFEKEWGLGSSSTLTHMVANWADVHPLMLHFKAFNGSGYDVACAGSETPILYQLDGDNISYEPLDAFRPKFGDSIYFVYMNQKQSSAASVDYYSKKVKGKEKKAFAKALSECTEAIIDASGLDDFNKVLEEHEAIVSKTLDMPSVKEERFSDFWGSMKSLGAWGGDFVMVASDRKPAETREYFQNKGYSTILTINDLLI